MTWNIVILCYTIAASSNVLKFWTLYSLPKRMTSFVDGPYPIVKVDQIYIILRYKMLQLLGYIFSFCVDFYSRSNRHLSCTTGQYNLLAKLNWCSMEKNYPPYSKYDSKTQLQDLAGLPSYLYYSNTCAMRLSYALIQSGIAYGYDNWQSI